MTHVFLIVFVSPFEAGSVSSLFLFSQTDVIPLHSHQVAEHSQKNEKPFLVGRGGGVAQQRQSKVKRVPRGSARFASSAANITFDSPW